MGAVGPQCAKIYSHQPAFLMLPGFKPNPRGQLGLCVLSSDWILEAIGSYENILFGESEMIQFTRTGLEESETGGRKSVEKIIAVTLEGEL